MGFILEIINRISLKIMTRIIGPGLVESFFTMAAIKWGFSCWAVKYGDEVCAFKVGL